MYYGHIFFFFFFVWCVIVCSSILLNYDRDSYKRIYPDNKIFLHENICCGYQGASNEYPRCMFLSRNKKTVNFLTAEKSVSSREMMKFRGFVPQRVSYLHIDISH